MSSEAAHRAASAARIKAKLVKRGRRQAEAIETAEAWKNAAMPSKRLHKPGRHKGH